MNKTKCSCANENCNTVPVPCAINECDTAKNTIPLAFNLLSGKYSTILVTITGPTNGVDGASGYDWESVDPSNFLPGKYYIVPKNEGVYDSQTNSYSGSGLDEDEALPFIFDISMFTSVVIGGPTSTLNDFIALVGYISDRISCLHLPCCVKNKVIDAINNYVAKLMGPDGSTVPFTLRFEGQFNELCRSERIAIPMSGPIYIGNVLTIPLKGGFQINTSVPLCENINYVVEFLRFVQIKLRIAYSARCCCNDAHEIDECAASFAEVCEFVFGRLCVIDLPETNCTELCKGGLVA